MKENFWHDPVAHELRIQAVEEYLNNLKDKKPFEVGDIVACTSGEYKLKGLKVISKENGKINILPSPESTEPVEFNESELFHVDEVENAWKEALKKYHYSSEELGLENKDWPEGKLN